MCGLGAGCVQAVCRLCAGCVQRSAIAASQLFLELIRVLTTGFRSVEGHWVSSSAAAEGGEGVRAGEEAGEGARAEGRRRGGGAGSGGAGGAPARLALGSVGRAKHPPLRRLQRAKEATRGGEQGGAEKGGEHGAAEEGGEGRWRFARYVALEEGEGGAG